MMSVTKTVIALALFALVNAAPPFFDSSALNFHPAFGKDEFDTPRFWSDLEGELRHLDDMLENFRLFFPKTYSQAAVVNNQYKVIIPLHGFKESEIAVKAREGMLMVQAVRKSGEYMQQNYIDMRSLPAEVDSAGTWVFEDGVLTITFELKATSTTDSTVQSNEVTTSGIQTREEMDHIDNNEIQDADVGLQMKNNESILKRNYAPQPHETTTYAVDLKNEVEFVPINY